ncbi:hypothetical protein S7711_05172 [Stachybotrys chartarum IBT 7711]|uniref:Protein PNS1 n=1 Tax=Stachybotrys chartarum (strain CBS 109288 / IBT 7711) TaxID=1280523 RepID=A0A084B4M0_STACB|nr:hypothetical protein S7711_05172 [Stachybotrys chartarum IBT 7711]KFA48335.1 hypothetical protein S40293_04434 [Stachybotrys chartarum IBT 40293]
MGEADRYYNPNAGGGYGAPPPPPPPQYNQQQAYYNNAGYEAPPVPPHPGQNGAYAPDNGYGQQQQQQQAYYTPNPPPPHADEKYGFDQAFKVQKPKYNDLWAGILLIVVFAGFVGVSAWSLNRYAATAVVGSFTFNRQTILLFVVVLAAAFALSVGYVALARYFTKQFIWATGILNIVWTIGTAVYYLYRGSYPAGIVFLVFGLFLAFCFYTWISRIPFSTLMLQTSIDVSRRYGHVYLVSLLGGIVATALAAWFAATLTAIYVAFSPSVGDAAGDDNDASRSDARVIGLIAFVTFAMYWVSEWLKNTVHTTVAGVYGSWYFCPHNFPKDATRGALKRALTYSFGSIALGSLIVAVIQFLRQLCSVARQSSAEDGGVGGMIGVVVFCLLGCIIAILEWAVEFVNRYAFAHIALYGKAYIAAAKDTWTMIKSRGLDALINECLIGPVLSFGALFIGVACCLISYLFLQARVFSRGNSGDFDDDFGNSGATPVVMAFSFLIGFQIANVFTTPLSSGVDTIFVAMGWDPQVMYQDHPELYQNMVRVYPKVQQTLQRR